MNPTKHINEILPFNLRKSFILSGNREAAFFQAITSAGVVYKVTRACNSNKYGSICTCDMRHGEAYPAQTNNANTNNNNNRPSKNNRKSQQPFKWTYCNDNIKFGMNFAQRFLDAREVGNDARVLMNKQNNLAGRAVSYTIILYILYIRVIHVIKHGFHLGSTGLFYVNENNSVKTGDTSKTYKSIDYLKINNNIICQTFLNPISSSFGNNGHSYPR